jgi:hypothetical protein
MLKTTALVLFGILAGCGGGSATTGGPDGGGPIVTGKDASAAACAALSPAGAVLSWQSNGTPECAVAITATVLASSSMNLLEVVGGSGSGLGVALTVTSYTGPLAGTYHCKTDAGVLDQYVDFVYTGTVSTGAVVDCAITIISPGVPGTANATGTFSATLSGSGGTTLISNGVFNTPVTGS